MAPSCPRCGLPMRTEKYEGASVDGCPECWGYWLDKGEFQKIATSRRLVFSAEERKQIVAAAAAAAQKAAAPDAPIACPRCAKTMEKVTVEVGAPLTLDCCREHGVWFDTKELKLAQVLTEDAMTVRKLFFEKLRER